MKRREKFVHIFLLFFAFAFLLFIFSQSGFVKDTTGLLEQVTGPLRKGTFSLFSGKESTVTEDKLREQVKSLQVQVAKYQALEKDNKALRDQFESADVSSQELLPAKVVGFVTFIPGVSPVEQLVIDKGERDGVRAGDVVVFKNNLVGKIIITYPHVSKVNLVSQKDTSLTAETSRTSAIGLVQGKGAEEIVLGNVVLADKLEKEDLVITKGDVSEKGSGYPPDLVIGKIVAVHKRASDLFQVAEVQSLVNFSKLKMVFVIRGEN